MPAQTSLKLHLLPARPPARPPARAPARPQRRKGLAGILERKNAGVTERDSRDRLQLKVSGVSPALKTILSVLQSRYLLTPLVDSLGQGSAQEGAMPGQAA